MNTLNGWRVRPFFPPGRIFYSGGVRGPQSVTGPARPLLPATVTCKPVPTFCPGARPILIHLAQRRWWRARGRRSAPSQHHDNYTILKVSRIPRGEAAEPHPQPASASWRWRTGAPRRRCATARPPRGL
jgi:hypothetical protein